MDLEQVKAKIAGRKVVGVEADEWEEEYEWLTAGPMSNVVFELDNGVKLDCPEPVYVRFPEEENKERAIVDEKPR